MKATPTKIRANIARVDMSTTRPMNGEAAREPEQFERARAVAPVRRRHRPRCLDRVGARDAHSAQRQPGDHEVDADDDRPGAEGADHDDGCREHALHAVRPRERLPRPGGTSSWEPNAPS